MFIRETNIIDFDVIIGGITKQISHLQISRHYITLINIFLYIFYLIV